MEKGLSKAPHRRYSSAKEIYDDVKNALSGKSIHPIEKSQEERPLNNKELKKWRRDGRHENEIFKERVTVASLLAVMIGAGVASWEKANELATSSSAELFVEERMRVLLALAKYFGREYNLSGREALALVGELTQESNEIKTLIDDYDYIYQKITPSFQSLMKRLQGIRLIYEYNSEVKNTQSKIEIYTFQDGKYFLEVIRSIIPWSRMPSDIRKHFLLEREDLIVKLFPN